MKNDKTKIAKEEAEEVMLKFIDDPNKRIESAPTSSIDDLEFEVDMVLKALGFEKAFVTDESSVSDFMEGEIIEPAFPAKDGQPRKIGTIKTSDTMLASGITLQEASATLGIPIHKKDLIHNLAFRLVNPQ